MRKKMYRRKDELKSLGEWMKMIKLYDIRLTFTDGKTKETQTIAYSQEHAAFNGIHMNFGSGKAIKCEVVGWEDMTVKKFRMLGYTPSNVGLKEEMVQA